MAHNDVITGLSLQRRITRHNGVQVSLNYVAPQLPGRDSREWGELQCAVENEAGYDTTLTVSVFLATVGVSLTAGLSNCSSAVSACRFSICPEDMLLDWYGELPGESFVEGVTQVESESSEWCRWVQCH